MPVPAHPLESPHAHRPERRAALRRPAPDVRRVVPRRRGRQDRPRRPQRLRQDDAHPHARRRRPARRRHDHVHRHHRLPPAGPAHRRRHHHRARPDPVRARPRRRPAPDAGRGGGHGVERSRGRRAGHEALRPGGRRLRRRRWLRGRVGGGHDRHEPRTAAAGARAAAQHAVRRPAPPHRAGPHPVLRRRHPAPRRAHQPPRRRLHRVAARVPRELPRRARGHQPRRRAARADRHPGAAPRRQPRRGRRLQHGLEAVPDCSARPTSAVAAASGRTR